MRTVVMAAVIAAISAGCDRGTANGRGLEQPSIAQEMIDGATGHTAVKHGKKAMETVERVSRKEQKELEEVLE